jgi:hypothetical protein
MANLHETSETISRFAAFQAQPSGAGEDREAIMLTHSSDLQLAEINLLR